MRVGVVGRVEELARQRYQAVQELGLDDGHGEPSLQEGSSSLELPNLGTGLVTLAPTVLCGSWGRQ
jgi:hypothetical protein